MQSNFIAEAALGYFQAVAGSIDASTLVTSIIGAIPTARGPVLLLIVPEAQAIRWRDDGTAPTTTVGQPLAVGAELRYTGRDLKNLRVIGQAANAVLNITVYGHTVP